VIAPIALIVAAVSAVVAWRRRHDNRPLPAHAVIVSPRRSTSIAHDGAVRSAQSAELTLDPEDLDRIWTPANLENLARTYWRFLTRVTLGLIKVKYGADTRSIILLFRPLTLLRFDAPEYTMEAEHGEVRWLIRDGLLVARNGRGCGYLSLDVQRMAVDRGRLQHPGVRDDPIGHPCPGHQQLPALAGEARPGRVQDRVAPGGPVP
jgi:hypothetical protein